MLDLIFDGEVKFGIAVERFVAPNGEIGTSAPIFQPTFQFIVKAVHPPGRIGWTVIVVVGVADKDVVFESRDLCHVIGIQLVIRLSARYEMVTFMVRDCY